MIKLTDSNFIETVKADIEAVSVKSNEPSLYDDILNGVKVKRMFVFSGCGGFFVLMPIYFYGAPYVNIMMTCSNKGKALNEMLSFAKDRAREIEAKGFMFSTANERLERVAKRLGWTYRGKRGSVTDWLIKL
ncbi:TMhelix containing protein [Vibrio phage 1.205.O._10N.222.51.A7]|nr:TMhelix containing protein [Vibrio phage 1.205.O._10N.222.51.A7]